MNDKAVSSDHASGQWRAGTPQRYSINYGRYLSLGGPVRVEELMRGFVSGGANYDDMPDCSSSAWFSINS